MKIYDESMSLELKNEVHKLNSIIDALINLSDIDSFSDTEEVNLLDIINNIINSYNSKIEIKNISIKTTIPKTFNVNTNKNNLYIVLSNII
jgi:signal transduction histidine kinase